VAAWAEVGGGLFVGLATLDVVQHVERVPGPNEKVVSTSVEVSAGGPATNAAVTFAALGGEATLLTALGTSPVQPVIIDDLNRHDVAVVDAAAPGHPGPAISAVSVVVGSGDRSVVSRNAEEACVDVPANLADLVNSVGVVLVDGHLPALAGAAAAAAGHAGIPVVLDGGSWKPPIAEVLPHVEAAVCSADFAVPGCTSAAKSAQALLTMGVSFVAFTDGPRAVRWWTKDGFGAVDVRSVTARDTLGAGDVFHGAFAFAVAGHADPVGALRFAVDVAAVRVEKAGPRAWLSDPRLEALARQIDR
jgi:sugar/nucleoside kinase (ribokinase family)